MMTLPTDIATRHTHNRWLNDATAKIKGSRFSQSSYDFSDTTFTIQTRTYGGQRKDFYRYVY